MSLYYDVAILGAGAAGLICASTAGKRGRRVVLLEHNERVGKKILISGGGRCNFTHLNSKPENFISQNPHFCKSALSRFRPEDFLSLVKKYQIPYFEKSPGQLFCQNSAKDITRLLLQECREADVEIKLNFKIGKVSKSSRFIIEGSETIEAASLVVATGALSYPQLGASDFGYKLAKNFDIAVLPQRPALVPLLFNAEDRKIFAELSGVSLEAEASFGKIHFREPLLFTHQGLSGPAILQISSYWQEGQSIRIKFLPELELANFLLEQKRRGEKALLKNLLGGLFPKRFAELSCERLNAEGKVHEYSDAKLRELGQKLQYWDFLPQARDSYRKAEVTVGGIDTDELSSQSMEAKKVKGLYFIGEVIDVTGQLGGHNFQWAWASGVAAGGFV